MKLSGRQHQSKQISKAELPTLPSDPKHSLWTQRDGGESRALGAKRPTDLATRQSQRSMAPLGSFRGLGADTTPTPRDTTPIKNIGGDFDRQSVLRNTKASGINTSPRQNLRRSMEY